MNRATLTDFLALELPLLLSAVDPSASDQELEARLLSALEPAVGDGSPAHPLWPGLDRSGAAAAALAEDRLKLEGFFERQRHLAGIRDDERLLMLERMVLTRALDQRLKLEFDQKRIAWNGYASPQKGFRSTGQEAIVGAALPLRRPPAHTPGPGYDGDVIAPLIRDLGALLMFMPDPVHALRVQFGKTGTPVGGRDLHLGDFEHGVLPPAAPLTIATQTAVGLALASAQRGEDRVFCSFVGDGASSLGEWHESINFAAARKLPMIFCIENNHWALGTHVSEQTATRRFAARGIGYGIVGASVFGNDPEQIAAAFAWGADRARRGAGPTLIEVVTYRRPGHAHHDDDRFHGSPDGSIPGYEYDEERRAWEALDPVDQYRARLIEADLIDAAGFAAMEAAAARQVEEAARVAEETPWPRPEEYRAKVFAPSEPAAAAPAQPQTRVLAYDEAVRQALIEAMEANPEVFVLGEDVGGRYGGAFGVTRGLAKRFGDDRCLNTPLAESAIVGAAVGAALAGKRPVAEMQFADFLATGFNALVNNAAKVHWRWGRPVPLVVRLPYGGATGDAKRLLGGGPFHSQCPEMWFVRTPGWKIVAPSTPADAKGLMLAAIRDPNPVLFLEAKGLYGFFRTDLREAVPLGVEHEVPIGSAAIRRVGADCSVLAYGSMVWTALDAASQLATRGIDVEVIDLRSLVPLDLDTIAASVEKTGRVLLVHEDSVRGGFGGELAAQIADRCFPYLDAPILRVGAPDTPVPYSPPLEHDFLPDVADIRGAIDRLIAY